MAVAGCINAYDCAGCYLTTLQQLQSDNIGVAINYTAPWEYWRRQLDYIKYTDKCGCTCCLTGENELRIVATQWVIKNFTLTNDDTNEVVNVKWNDLFGSNRAYTMVRYKTWSYPTSITDWTLAVKETTQNQYSVSWYNVSGLTDWTTYYFTAFAVSQDGTIIVVQQKTITTDFIFAWYQRVEYIGANWIQYTVIWNSFKTSYKSIIDFKMTTIWWDYIPIWMRNSSNYRYWVDAWNGYFQIISWWNDWTKTKVEDKNRHIITIDKNTAIVDWTSYSIKYVNATFSYWIWVFVYNQETIEDRTNWRNDLYKLDIYDENWNHIYDLYPVYRKSDNVIWLLDIISKQFYTNRWSWTFTKWPNIN